MDCGRRAAGVAADTYSGPEGPSTIDTIIVLFSTVPDVHSKFYLVNRYDVRRPSNAMYIKRYAPLI